MTADPHAAKIEQALKALISENPLARRQLESEARDAAAADGDSSTPADAAAPEADRQHLRQLEAILFAAEEALDLEALRALMPRDAEVSTLLIKLQHDYADRGVNLVRVAGKWRLRTAPDLAGALVREREEPKNLSQAARETLAIIAYHQPATRADIEAVRGVGVSKGSLDQLMEIGWVRTRGRRRSPGRPMLYVTTTSFLEHFGLDDVADLPGKADLKAAGLLNAEAPDDFEVPDPAAALEALENEAAEADQMDFHLDYLEDDEKA